MSSIRKVLNNRKFSVINSMAFFWVSLLFFVDPSKADHLIIRFSMFYMMVSAVKSVLDEVSTSLNKKIRDIEVDSQEVISDDFNEFLSKRK